MSKPSPPSHTIQETQFKVFSCHIYHSTKSKGQSYNTSITYPTGPQYKVRVITPPSHILQGAQYKVKVITPQSRTLQRPQYKVKVIQYRRCSLKSKSGHIHHIPYRTSIQGQSHNTTITYHTGASIQVIILPSHTR